MLSNRNPLADLPPPTSLPMDDDWARCNAEAVVAALSVRYRFSRAKTTRNLQNYTHLQTFIERHGSLGAF